MFTKYLRFSFRTIYNKLFGFVRIVHIMNIDHEIYKYGLTGRTKIFNSTAEVYRQNIQFYFCVKFIRYLL